MDIIFLDMDGVLNSVAFFDANPGRNPGTNPIVDTTSVGDSWWTSMVDAEAVARLNRVIEATGAKIVISSSWRYHCEPEKMQRILEAEGFKGEVIGRTPFHHLLPQGIRDLDGSRGQEISVWLTENTHLDIENFVILDDLGPRAFAHVAPHLVHTTWGKGLLDEHVAFAIRMLLKGPDCEDRI